MRPVLEQEDLDRLEEGAVVLGELDVSVGGEGEGQGGKIITRKKSA